MSGVVKMAAEALNPGAVGMLIFGIVTLYIFGLLWGIVRAWKKGRERKAAAS